MDGNVNANVAPMNPNPPPAWTTRTPFKMACPLHNFPQNADKSLPNFYLREGIYVDDHLQSFFLALEILSVENEVVVCRFFPNTFKAKVASWYFGLQ